MRLFDTHGHLTDPAFDGDREQVIANLRAAGVERAMVVADPCEEIPNQEAALALTEKYPFLYGAIGVHPQYADRYSEAAEATIRQYLALPKFVCLGEIGLDYHYDDAPDRQAQRDVFARQLRVAKALDVPAELHIRDAHGDATQLLTELHRQGALPTCVMHCYSGSWESAQVYLNMGMYISFSGSVTFKNAPKLKEVAKNVPADRLLLETDCPYMAPTPLRGRRNEPAYVAYTAACVAELRGVRADALAAKAYENAVRVFGLEGAE